MVEFVDDTQKITFSNDASLQESYIQSAGARLSFNASNLNVLSLNQRMGYSEGFSQPSDQYSILTKQEVQDLISASGGSGGGGSGGGGIGGSTLSRADGSLLALQDASRLILTPNNNEDVTVDFLGTTFTGKLGMVCDQTNIGKRRIAGSSALLSIGLELHPQ